MGRAPCCSKVGLHKGPWTTREDALLLKYIEAHGEGQWRSLPKKAGLLRCGKSCRLRWMNYLRPDIKRGNITRDEEDLILRLHGLLGNRWSLIAGRLPGRTDNEIKNYWNTHLIKKGRDPNTELEKSTNNNSKKRGRSSNAKKGKTPKMIKIHNNNNNNNNNNEKNGSEEIRDETENTSGSSSQTHGLTLFDPDNVMIDMTWVLNSKNIVDDDDYHGRLDHLMMIDHDHDHDVDDDHNDDEIVAPPDDAIQLEKLYEEYLQLIKEDHDHELDSFTESFLI